MQPASRFLDFLKTLPLFALSLLVLFSCLATTSVLAAEQNTAFMPFKINAPNAQEMIMLTDKALQNELAEKKFPYYLKEDFLKELGLSGNLSVSNLVDTEKLKAPNLLSRILSVELLIRDDF